MAKSFPESGSLSTNREAANSLLLIWHTGDEGCEIVINHRSKHTGQYSPLTIIVSDGRCVPGELFNFLLNWSSENVVEEMRDEVAVAFIYKPLIDELMQQLMEYLE